MNCQEASTISSVTGAMLSLESLAASFAKIRHRYQKQHQLGCDESPGLLGPLYVYVINKWQSMAEVSAYSWMRRPALCNLSCSLAFINDTVVLLTAGISCGWIYSHIHSISHHRKSRLHTSSFAISQRYHEDRTFRHQLRHYLGLIYCICSWCIGRHSSRSFEAPPCCRSERQPG